MGIRFRCHHCEAEMNLKNFQAGKRGRCPECSGRFRVPNQSTDYSLPLEDGEDAVAVEELRAIGALSQSSASSVTAKQPAAKPTVREVLKPEPGPVLPAEKLGARRREVTSSSQAKPASRESKVESSARPVAAVVSAAGDVASSNGAAPSIASSASNAADFPLPAAVAESPLSVWYVRPATGGQFGPADGKVFVQWLSDGRVAPEAYVWRDGWPDWQPASVGLADFFAAAGLAAASEQSAAIVSAQPLSMLESSNSYIGAAPSDASTNSVPVGSMPAAGLTSTVPNVAAPIGLDTTAGVGGIDSSRPAAGAATLMRKRRQTRNRYAVGIGLLAVVALLLIIVLVVVVTRG
ncbi:MAG: DUF4339 domain-containing protein [Pirellulales bacterium]